MRRAINSRQECSEKVKQVRLSTCLLLTVYVTAEIIELELYTNTLLC